MSLLAEVISSAEKIGLEEINTNVPQVTSAITKLKGDFSTLLENIYVKYREQPKKNKQLSKRASDLQRELNEMKTVVEESLRKNMQNSEKKMSELLKELTKNSSEIDIICNLCTIHEKLVEIRKLQADGMNVEAMQKLLETKHLFSNNKLGDQLSAFKELAQSFYIEEEMLLAKLNDAFHDNVMLEVKENKTIIKIKSDSEYIKEILTLFYHNKQTIACLDKITSFLWHNCFVPLVDYTTQVEVFQDNNIIRLELVIVDKSKKMIYFKVFHNITKLIQFLSNNFNHQIDEDLTTLSYIGRDLCDNLSELLVKNCLRDTIPKTEEELKKYDVVIKATEELESVLKSANIFSDDVSILEYANNVDVLFINNKCQEYVIAAQNLMKQDLHNMVEVGEEVDNNSIELQNVFPKSSVSRSCLELIELMEKILIQASKSSEVCAGRLFCTVKNICKKYATFLPEYHKKLLQTIPQQIALFYNNCMYIGYKLNEWNDSYLKQLPSTLCIESSSFKDEGLILQETALDIFINFLHNQIKQIEEIMKSSNLQNETKTLEQLEPTVEKSLRQCLRQQELLKTVWIKVLPYDKYNKSQGEILDALCNFMINSVLIFEDISTEAGEQLVELFKMVQTRGPKLFTDAREVGLFVPSWYKFNEVMFVLGATLVDIHDRWADGKGPLALQLKPEQLKQLIRALFQNTERRAALLAKIHY